MASLPWHEAGRWDLLSSLCSLSSLWICLCSPVLCLCCAYAHELYMPVQVVTTWRRGKMNISFWVLRMGFFAARCPKSYLVSVQQMKPPLQYSPLLSYNQVWLCESFRACLSCVQRRVLIPLLMDLWWFVSLGITRAASVAWQHLRWWTRGSGFTQWWVPGHSHFFSMPSPPGPLCWVGHCGIQVFSAPVEISRKRVLVPSGDTTGHRLVTSWVTLLGCQHWCVLHSCSAKAPAFAAVSMWEGDHIHTSNCSYAKGIIPLLLSTLSSFGCTLSTPRATSQPPKQPLLHS